MNCPKTLEKMLWKIVFGVAIALAHQFCYCDEHKVGNFNGGETVFDKEIFNQVKEEGVARPKNYTIIFKYIGPESTKLTYAVFNVENAVSIWHMYFKLK